MLRRCSPINLRAPPLASSGSLLRCSSRHMLLRASVINRSAADVKCTPSTAPSPSNSTAAASSPRIMSVKSRPKAVPSKETSMRASESIPRDHGTHHRGAAAARSVTRDLRAIPTAYHSFRNAVPIREFKAMYDSISVDTKREDVTVRVGGRVISIRGMGRIMFLTIAGAGEQLQIIWQVSERATKGDLRHLRRVLRVGDIVGAEGHPGRARKGELSLYADQLHIIAPYVCTDQTICPDLRGLLPLADDELRYRYRFMDLMANPKAIKNVWQRHNIIAALRQYLNSHHFVEVETPILSSVASGASARPFMTHHHDHNTNLFLRVAPELYLKQCVVGGLERVFEIGRVFRNEDADRTHNPEFTSCEFYAAYHTYEDLMPMTEAIARTMARAANGTTVVRVCSCVTHELVEIDLGKPFRRVRVYEEIQRAAGVELPPPPELNTPRGLAYMAAIMLLHGIPLPPVRTAAKMFEKLIDFFITDRIVEPTFVLDHPLFMSPLAKEHASQPGISERFELFINGVEYCNAYSELNDPREQHRRFEQQLVDRRHGDDEAMMLDQVFLKALQAGLPPTAGWGMGVDRMVTLLNGSTSIREDILFPQLRADGGSHDAKRQRRTASFFGFSEHMTLFCLNALEEELRRRGAPSTSVESVQQLRKSIALLQKQLGCDQLLHLKACEVQRWKRTAVAAILSFFCGRFSK